jgi:PIN domain nuclease of toxin-antitoxin system
VRCLLDTHALVWSLAKPGRLPKSVREIVEDPANDVFASAASAWEIGIKAALGKIQFPLAILDKAVSEAGFVELPVSLRHAMAIRDLPMHHRDPFDRLLVAQALREGLVLLTRDEVLSSYGVRTFWG